MNFPTKAGAFDKRLGGEIDVFVTKLNAAGSTLVYSTFLGGSDSDQDGRIAIDAAGSAYVSGSTSSRNFPTTASAFDRRYNGERDAFVTKLNAAGSNLVYSTYLGGSFVDDGNAIAVDGAGSAYVTGSTSSENFPTTAGAFDRGLDGGDAFVTKLSPNGSALAYSTYLGGREEDEGAGLAVDGAGRAYLTGWTASGNFPTTASAFDRSYNGGGYYGDAFVTKLNADGSALAYSTFLGGNRDDDGRAIAVDAAESAYLTGRTESRSYPTTADASDTTQNGERDVFVTKLNADGSALAYSTYIGGTSSERGDAVAVDGGGSAFLTGRTGSDKFPTTAGAFDVKGNPRSGDAFVAKLTPSGSTLAYSTYLGGSSWDDDAAIAVDTGGRAYVTGRTESRDFPTTAGAFDPSLNDDWPGDAFVAKLDLIAGPPSCLVPRVVGMRLAQAKRRIRAEHCSLGRIRRVRSTRVGHVLAQSPRAGAVRRRGFKVGLVVGRR